MGDTKTKILDLAEAMTQTRGFNGFSYLDIAAEIGIKNSSIHHHFKSKADLGLALVERVHERHLESFAQISRSIKSPRKRLKAVVEHFQAYVDQKKFCLCGMMTAELQSVSAAVSERLTAYFRDFRNWLAAQFAAMDKKNPKTVALSFISALEGALVIARLESDPDVIDDATKLFM
jgi:TetR/AcrR family transcriptional repressor of nem operon